jgi:hypothetical protein
LKQIFLIQYHGPVALGSMPACPVLAPDPNRNSVLAGVLAQNRRSSQPLGAGFGASGPTPACPVQAPDPNRNVVLAGVLVLVWRSSRPPRCNVRLPPARQVQGRRRQVVRHMTSASPVSPGCAPAGLAQRPASPTLHRLDAEFSLQTDSSPPGL